MSSQMKPPEEDQKVNRKLAAVAALYNKRNEKYQQFVHRIQTFFVNMKEETELRQRRRKEENLFVDKDKETI